MPIVESSQILIRLACPQDRKEIIQLEKLAIKNLCQDIYNQKKIDNLTKQINHLRFNDEVVFVAEKDNTIIGFASLLSYRQTVRTLYVQHGLIRQEIGTKLLNAIEAEAIKRKIQILKVTSSLTERSFYNSQGYQEVAFCHLGKMDILMPCIAMQKRLRNSSQSYWRIHFLLRIIMAIIPNTLFILLVL